MQVRYRQAVRKPDPSPDSRMNVPQQQLQPQQQRRALFDHRPTLDHYAELCPRFVMGSSRWPTCGTCRSRNTTEVIKFSAVTQVTWTTRPLKRSTRSELRFHRQPRPRQPLRPARGPPRRAPLRGYTLHIYAGHVTCHRRDRSAPRWCTDGPEVVGAPTTLPQWPPWDASANGLKGDEAGDGTIG